MDENSASEETWKREAAAQEEAWRQHAAAQEEAWKRHAAAQDTWWKQRMLGQQEEILRQDNLMYGGLIAIGIVMIQPFLAPGAAPVELAGKICVIAFAVAIPLLAALVVLNRQEIFRKRATKSGLVLVAKSVALGVGFLGVVAGFWQILPLAGIGALVFAFIGLFVHSAGYTRVEQDDAEGTESPES
ncbi:APC family permease [Flindersiella endophytica]